MTTKEQRKICEAIYKIISMANKTIKELGMAFALLALKEKEEQIETKR